MSKDPEQHIKDLYAILDTKLVKHMERKKSFRVTNDAILAEEDFLKIYELIECVVAVKGFKLTKEEDKTRMTLFKGFSDNNSWLIAGYLKAVEKKIEID